MNSNPDANEKSGDDSTTTAMCCAQFYEQDIVQELMGDSFHPGGRELSRTLVSSLGLSAGSQVLDVASGVGTTTSMMANDFGFNSTGLDFSDVNRQKAEALARTKLAELSNPEPCCAPGESCCEPEPALAQLGSTENSKLASPITPGELNFIQGSADALPIDDEYVDGLICECAVSTFADQTQVAREFARVLKPGGTFGMTDMVLNGAMPAEFADKVAPWTCMAKALTVDGYRSLFEAEGLKLITNSDHSNTLLQLATEMKRKLVMFGMGKSLGAIPDLGMNLTEMRAMLAEATALVKAGTIQYGLLVFQK